MEKEMPFEEALAQLETLVGRMETGKLPIEELIADFEKGSALVKSCRARLDQLERKIELLTKDDGKNGEWSDFNAVPDPSRNAPEPPAGQETML